MEVKFEWDTQKEAANVAKHGVDFSEAQNAFLDPRLVIAVDEGHSGAEPRLFCIGRSERGGILTVRFTYRDDRIRILLVPDTGGKAGKSMKNKTLKYTDDKGEIIGDLRPIKKGELPSLDQLVDKLRAQTKVTLVLDNEAVAFFKREANKRHTSYQRMIRNLVLSYARSHAR